MTDVLLHAPFAGWLSTLDEVGDPVFAERMMGEGGAIDPIEGTLRAPADAEVVSVAATSHAVTLRVANGAEILLHLGLETVALGGRGFAVRVAAGDRVMTGDPLVAFDLDAVARAAKDLVTPIVAPGEGVRVVLDRPGRMVVAGDPIGRVTAADRTAAATSVDEGEVLARSITVSAPQGIHARPAARIVALLRRFDAQVSIEHGDRRADGSSTVALLAFGAREGDTLAVRARGADAAAALDALAAFAAERFGDPETLPEPPPTASEGGIRAAPGLAIGHVRQFRPAAIAVREQGSGAARERAALDTAIGEVAARLDRAGDEKDLADAHRELLSDPELRRAALNAIDGGVSAGVAWRDAIGAAAATLESVGDPRLAERVADLRDLERQVLAALGGEAEAVLPDLRDGTILIAEDLLPSQFLALDRTRLAGIVTAAGGPTAHVAILAAAAGVPMLVAAGRAVLAHPDGATAILDADAAMLDVDPAPDRLARASERLAAEREASEAAARDAHRPAATGDGTRIEVFANLGSVEDAAAAVAAGAEGCGLLRTEFLFLDRDVAPDEAEQRVLYARIAATLGERPLIVRTLDIGGDKPVPYLPRAVEENPALGQRGIRLSLARPDLFAAQLRAILTGVPGARCRIMLPMIADFAELVAARHALDAAMAATGRTDPVQLGVMVETPAAALLADQLAAGADFLSVGTNDLTQYALAADRGNAAVAGLVDALHPAVLRLIELAAKGAAAHGRWLGVCGGLASDPRAATLLIGLGVTELSAVSAAVPAVKAAVRGTDMPAARDLARRALAAATAGEVRALLEEAR